MLILTRFSFFACPSENYFRLLTSFSSVVRVNNTLYLSGVIGIDRETKELAYGGIKHETEVVFANIKSILEEFGSSFDKGKE